jgi:hypothetical protein
MFNSKAFTQLIFLTLFGLSVVFWFLLSFRFVAIPVLIALSVAWNRWIERRRTGRLVWLWLAFTVASLQPIDVYPLNVPGPPRLVPYVMGYPRTQTREAAKRGDVVLGGCMVDGFEPKYVWVW